MYRYIFQSTIESNNIFLERAQKNNNSKHHRATSFFSKGFYSSFSEDIDQLTDTDLDEPLELYATGDVDWENKATVTMDSTRAEQLYHESRKLLYNLTVMPQQEASRPENWTEIEQILKNLSNTRTAEAVDLSWSLLEAIIKNLNVSHDDNVTSSDEDDTEYDLAHAQFLTDWDLWYSILVNWHQVSKESLEFVNSASTTKIMKPSELLSKLDEWNGTIRNATMKFTQQNQGYEPEQEAFNCTNSKALSLLIDIVARFGKRLINELNSVPRELVPYAEFAENILLRMTEQSEAGSMRSETNFPPSAINLNMVLMLWARALMVDRAWKLLQYTKNSSVIRPDLWSYNAVIHAYSKAGDGKSAERVLYELLQQQQKEQERYEFDVAIGSQIKEFDVIQPSIITWNSVLAAWARSVDKVKGAERVEQLLGTMVAYSNGGRISCSSDGLITAERLDGKNVIKASPALQQSVKPNLITLNTALSAWARAGEAETCARLLSEMRELYSAGQLSDPPDVFSYATAMNGFAKANQPEKAEALWDGMYQAYKQGAKELKPTLPMMSTILDAYSRQIMNAVTTKKYEIAFSGLARAERTFERMRELFLSGDLDSSPDTAAYNIMLKCYLFCARANALPKDADLTASIADELLLEMKKLYESKEIYAAPTFTTYSIVIQSWLTRADGVARAIQLLDEAWQKQTTGDPRMKPDLATITSLVTAFCYAKQPKVAQKFLLSTCDVRKHDPSGMVEPKIDSFGAVFAGLQRSSDDDAATFAQALFDQMKFLHKSGVISYEPDCLIYQSLLSIWANSAIYGASKKAYGVFHEMKQRAAQGDKSMEPDLKMCHQVLFSLSGKNPEPAIAESMVREMFADYKSNKSSVKPDNKTFNYALSAWARFDHPEAIIRADALFKEMQIMHKEGEISCDVVTFNILMHCLALTSKREAAERAEKLLLRMIELADSGHEEFRPTVVSYGCLISAWIRVLDLPRAEAILVNMFRESQNGKEYLKPHARHFEQVSRAWLSTNDRDKQNRSQAVQNLMKLVYPSLNSNATASNKGRQ